MRAPHAGGIKGADINLPTILNETVENDPKQR
jgi:hypothetical protein